MYSIVIPITRYIKFSNSKLKPDNIEHDNFRRFFEISWILNSKNLDWENIHTVFIVIPSNEIKYFKKNFKEKRTNIEIIDEYDILGIPSEPIGNTRKQMLIKLLISFRVKTKTYLTLDDDIGVINTFNQNFLYDKGKLVLSNASRLTHEPWWIGSSYMLGIKYEPNKLDKLSKKGLLMDVTPEMLDTKSSKELCNYLKKKWGKNWINELIIKNVEYRWSEYTLYWLYISFIKKNMKRLYIGTRVQIGSSLWDFSNDPNIMINYLKNNFCKDKKSYFGTIPSNIYINKLSVIKEGLKDCKKL